MDSIDEDDEDDELLIYKPEVFLYNIPSKQLSLEDVNLRAADWDTANPTWQGKIRIYMAGACCHVQLDDPQGNVYGQAVLEGFPGKNIKPTLDSSRYFALNLQNKEGTVRLVGMGFSKREDSSDIRNILRDYFGDELSRKRKLEPAETVNSVPPKKIHPTEAYTIFNQTNDPDYKYFLDGMFQCDKCPENFSDPNKIIIHWKKTHFLNKSAPCFCKLPFPYREERRTHVKNCHPNTFTCKKCGARLLEESELIPHFEEKHANVSKTKPGPGNPSSDMKNFSLKCANCGEGFLSKQELLKHFRALHTVHVKTGPEEAKGQGKKKESGDHAYNLTKDPDYKYITGPGSHFQCHKCVLKLQGWRNIKKHWMDDHQLKVKNCGCNLPFPDNKELLAHLNKFHVFPCLVCTVGFTTERFLEEHMLDEHRCDLSGKKINALETKFGCEKCQEHFSYRTLLKKHVRKAHPVEDDITEKTSKNSEKPEVAISLHENETGGQLDGETKGTTQGLIKGDTSVGVNAEANQKADSSETSNKQILFPCKECKKVFKCEQGLDAHMKTTTKHGKAVTATVGDEQEAVLEGSS